MKRLLTLALSFCILSFSYAQSITFTGALSSSRWFHQSQLLNNGRVLVFGGDNGNFSNPIVYKTAQLYSPSTGTWVNTGSLTTQRTDFASSILPNGNVIAIGGTLYLGGPNYLEKTNSCEIYDVTSGVWLEAKKMKEARAEHKAILLHSGKVLVVGGGTKRCELYDPTLDSWFLTDSTTNIGGDGLSILALADGRILATEGFNAEIFDPLTEEWTVISNLMKGDRVDHSSVLLKDGRVLLSGSIRSSDQNTAEIFNPSDNSFTQVASMAEFRGNSPAILMDNGKVLAFGIGDPFSPSDTKLIEVYDPIANTWSSVTFDRLGTQGYTIHKLGNGKIIVVGGSWTTGNGASMGCYLIDQGLTGCTTPNLNLPISGSSGCWGSTGKLTIGITESDVKYQGFMGSIPVTELVNGNGSTLEIDVNSNTLVQGKNELSIRAQRAGCPSYLLTNVGVIDAINESSISLTADKYYLCPGDGALIDGPSAYSSYLWSNGKTTEDIYTTEIGPYKLIVSNGGCKSVSGQIYIDGILSPVNAGIDQNVCTHNAPFTLVGSPSGGVWSGNSVVSGMFDPAVAGPGTYILSYSFCNQTDTRVVTVTQSVTPSVSISIYIGSNPSPTGDAVYFYANGINAGTNPTYKYKINNVTKGTLPDYSSTTLKNNDQVICELTSNATCANPTVVTSNIIKMVVGPAPSIISSVPVRNTHNISPSTDIQINFNQILNSNSYSDSCIIITGSFTGNQSAGSLNYSGNGTDKIVFNPATNFFAGEKVTVSLTKKTNNEIGIPIINPLSFRFKIKSSPSDAAFVRHKQSFPEIGNNGLVSSDLSPSYYCSGDFNKDGYLDYAAGFQTCSKIMIFYNNGDATFTKKYQYDVLTTGITSGDYDKDGDVDIAYSNSKQDKIFVLINDGTGSFSTTSFNTGLNPGKLVSADINADGTEDIVYTEASYSFNYKNIVVAFSSNGIFMLNYVLQISNCAAICIEDFDGDYDLDIAVADRPGQVYILSNKGKGSFTSMSPISIQPNDEIRGMAAADFDLDGDVDLACSQGLNGEAVILFNSGTLNFTSGNKFKVGNSPYNLNAEDYDGDGDIDLTVANKISSTISVRLNDGFGIFSGSLELDVEKPVTGILSGDFDNDQDIDIIAATELEENDYSNHLDIFTFINKAPVITIKPLARNSYCQNSIFDIFFSANGDFATSNLFYAELSDANGSFATPSIIGTSKKALVTCKLPANIKPGVNYRVRIRSTNFPTLSIDNGIDIEIFNNCPEIVSTVPVINQIHGVGNNELGITFTSNMDLNSFQKDNIHIVGSNSGLISNSGTFSGGGTSNLHYISAEPLFAGEKISIVVDSNITSSTGLPITNKKVYEVYAGSATNTIAYDSYLTSTNSGSSAHSIKDFDHDHDLDIITISQDGIDIKKNDGNGNLGANQKLINLLPTGFLSSFEVFDFDNDDDFDIVLTFDSNLYIYQNDGYGILTLIQSYNPGSNPKIHGAADFDADGFIDILIEQDQFSYPTKLQYYKNKGNGTFLYGKVISPPVTHTFKEVNIFDLDSDGDLDFIHWENYNYLYFCINDGWGNFTYRNDSLGLGSNYSATATESGDFDNDGDIDIILSAESVVYKTQKIQLLINNGSGYFTIAKTIDYPSGVEYFVKSDLDGDKDFDILACNNYGNTIGIFENKGMGNLELKQNLPFSATTDLQRASAGDFNGDMKMDIAVFHHYNNRIHLYLGKGLISTDVFNEISTFNLNIYPNPTDKIVNISIDNLNQEELEVEVRNLVGDEVYKKRIKGEELIQLDFSNFSSGVYMLKISSENSLVTKKIIVN